ncbi:Fic family protein [Corallincola holothuriorum]|uniref:Fic family protein n=2 Tax=Corallincola holothuriorum TaxID=2282215 RepID=A0A368NHQ8_9GAMM|nr:Fic family protein [Corallincola holothuriorum]
MAQMWIWQADAWPNFSWQAETILPKIRAVYRKQGILLGKTSVQSDPSEHALNTLLSNILASSAIENEQLNVQSVRSSLARRMGIFEESPYPTSDRSEGVTAMMLDALDNLKQPLSTARLFQWHRWLFPANELSMQPIRVGQLRGPEPMQVVSGRLESPVVHFEAPPRQGLEGQLQDFVEWFNQSRDDELLDPLLRSALCHLWFVTLHPFDDGNGRITRALTDMALAQADSQSIRLYAMSVAILNDRSGYYRILEQTQKGGLDITAWLEWFLDMLNDALDSSLLAIERTIVKTRFWQKFRESGFHPAQAKVLNRLLDGGEKGFENGINASQYQKVAKVSKATATRHLTELLDKGAIEKLAGGGRSTRYQTKLIE